MFYFERMGRCDWLQTCGWAWPASPWPDVVVTCPRLCSLAQSTKQEMEDGASLRRSEEAASSEEDSGLDVKVSNTTEEEKDQTPASGQVLRQPGNVCLNLEASDPETEQPKPPEGQSAHGDGCESEDHEGGEVRTEHTPTHTHTRLTCFLHHFHGDIKLDFFTRDADSGRNLQQLQRSLNPLNGQRQT